jgi:hypothetical protein
MAPVWTEGGERVRIVAMAILAAAVLVAPTGALRAKTDPGTWVSRILVELDSIQRKQGWLAQGEARPGSLASGGEAKLDYPLAAGSAYRFVVICESACGAGEVELLDPAGARVGEPRALVEMPKIEAVAATAGNYVLRVAMTDCASARCAWSARLYAKR